jgi:hypothetical protein
MYQWDNTPLTAEKVMKIRNLFFLLIFSLIFSGCALYPPISESLIFKDNSNADYTDKTYSFYRISFSNLIVNPAIPNKYLDKNNIELLSNSLNRLWLVGLSNFGVLYRLNNSFYIGFNTGLIFNTGIDFTFEIVDDYFITAEATLLTNYELIIQKRIINNVDFINTIGIIYRHDRLGFSENLMNNAINFYTNSVGVRSLNGFNLLNNEMILEISLLYVKEYNTGIINLGFSYNLYNLFK